MKGIYFILLLLMLSFRIVAQTSSPAGGVPPALPFRDVSGIVKDEKDDPVPGAVVYLKSPLDSTQVNMDKAKDLYTIYCAICHGDKGDGKGNLAKREKFAGVPDYKTRVITEGSVFHVETYGRNMMGSYANQLSQNERWMVARYVMKLKSE